VGDGRSFVSWIGLSPETTLRGKGAERKTRRSCRGWPAPFACRQPHYVKATATWRTVSSPAHPTRSAQSDYGMGAKLGRLVYRMLRYGQEYVDRGATHTKSSTANNKSIISEEGGLKQCFRTRSSVRIGLRKPCEFSELQWSSGESLDAAGRGRATIQPASSRTRYLHRENRSWAAFFAVSQRICAKIKFAGSPSNSVTSKKN